MEHRINAFEKGQGAMKALFGLGIYLAKSPVEQHLLDLIYFRVSQINGCAYCRLCCGAACCALKQVQHDGLKI